MLSLKRWYYNEYNTKNKKMRRRAASGTALKVLKDLQTKKKKIYRVFLEGHSYYLDWFWRFRL